MKLNKKNIFGLIGVLFASVYLYMAAYDDNTTFILVDTSLTDGDTIISTFHDIGGASEVTMFAQLSDSANVRIQPVFVRGAGGQRVANILDTFNVANIAGATPTSGAKVLSGYGIHNSNGQYGGDTNLIIGATRIAVKVTVNDVVTASTSGGASWVKVGLKYK